MPEPIRRIWDEGDYENWQWTDDSTARGDNTGTSRFVYRVHLNGRPLAWTFDTRDTAIQSIGMAIETT
jgi:hypothetical protein